MTTTRRRHYEYRYRDHSGGITRTSLERMRKHLRKIGVPQVVRAYRFRSTRTYQSDGEKRSYTGSNEAVLVKGTAGSVRFEGFCWGYGGEGPHGLRNLFLMLGVPLDEAERLAFKSCRKEDHELGIDWEYVVPRKLIPVWML